MCRRCKVAILPIPGGDLEVGKCDGGYKLPERRNGDHALTIILMGSSNRPEQRR